MDVCICVRRTLDWGDEAAVRAGMKPEFLPKMEAWNASFRMPYHRFRERLAEIARENWGRVKDAPVVPIDEVPEDVLAVPVDDDDWFAPDLAERLRAARRPGIRGYLWDRHVLEARPWRPPWRRGEDQRFTCGTNNYAVVPGDGWTIALLGHGKASRRFDADPGRVLRIRGALSIQNRNLSSQTVLGWRGGVLPGARLRRRYRRYRRLYEDADLPAALAWARPCVAAMADLMADLRWVR